MRYYSYRQFNGPKTRLRLLKYALLDSPLTAFLAVFAGAATGLVLGLATDGSAGTIVLLTVGMAAVMTAIVSLTAYHDQKSAAAFAHNRNKMPDHRDFLSLASYQGTMLHWARYDVRSDQPKWWK